MNLLFTIPCQASSDDLLHTELFLFCNYYRPFTHANYFASSKICRKIVVFLFKNI